MDVDVGVGAEARGSARGAAGVATNMMDGPAASSRATAVRGTGLEVNLGCDWSLLIEGGWMVCGEAESADEELAALRALLARFVLTRTDSEAGALGCGRRGLVDVAVVGGVLVFEPFQSDFLRSSFLGRNGMPVPEVKVFALFRGVLERE